MLCLSCSTPSGVAEQVEDKLISLRLTLSHRQPSLALWSCVTWNTLSLLSVYIYMDHTISMYIYDCITARRDTQPLNCSHKDSSALPATPKEQFQSISSSPVLVICILFLSCSLFPSFSLSLSWLSVFHLKAVLIIPTHTQNSCRRDTHITLISRIALAG